MKKLFAEIVFSSHDGGYYVEFFDSNGKNVEVEKKTTIFKDFGLAYLFVKENNAVYMG